MDIFCILVQGFEMECVDVDISILPTIIRNVMCCKLNVFQIVCVSKCICYKLRVLQIASDAKAGVILKIYLQKKILLIDTFTEEFFPVYENGIYIFFVSFCRRNIPIY